MKRNELPVFVLYDIYPLLMHLPVICRDRTGSFGWTGSCESAAVLPV